MRHGLLARMLLATVSVALVSIGATAWLATRNTSGAIRQQQGRTLSDDARINDTLLGYAATHPSWSGVTGTVQNLARTTGRRIALTTENREPITDSARPGTHLPVRASAVVDPLRVDVTLSSGASGTRIDQRAVAPFGVSTTERAQLTKDAEKHAACLRRDGQDVRIVYGLSGRPTVQTLAPDEQAPGPPRLMTPVPVPTTINCPPLRDPGTTRDEMTALQSLNERVNECLKPTGSGPITLNLDGSWDYLGRVLPDDPVPDCVSGARRAQLKPFVAPAALLFIGDAGDGAAPGVRLTAAGVSRIVAATGIVLALAVGVSAFLATRLVRPIHALTAAAQRMRDGDRTARVRAGDGELGRLGAAFNDMSEHLASAERQRKEMISDVSHELRTPLSNVRGWLEAVHDGVAELDPALVASLIEEMLLLQHIVDDLQQLALADAGRLRLRPEPVPVADLLDQTATAHRAQAEAAGLRLTVRADDIDVLADPVRLRQAVGNLTANALRYTPRGGAVELRAHAADGTVLIEVADTGTGIDAEALPHVFDRFWRADKSRNRRTGGSGLGLAIVRTLTEAQGGTATATSEPGEGTTFTLRLPAG
ncbi:Signal transduction histidine-protein kinase BaeS [Actinomadura rubteroloni]|uniref:histidine kinase n=1 Tax=Actinomadura rubteroloni TaxID=1926885 RepID=A0A2P4UMQ7_9ACTN|nr:ATP-binding protein [Actinomadura rubteroloni]POM26289.1 Signal transduction histidine-protein kinase BaeS [Actinomadura rubteroloni]